MHKITPPPPPPPICDQKPPEPENHSPEEKKRTPKPQPPCSQNISASSFLRQLLPKNIDTGDLLIILLLLLMAGDCADDKNTAMLTLALYLFL